LAFAGERKSGMPRAHIVTRAEPPGFHLPLETAHRLEAAEAEASLIAAKAVAKANRLNPTFI
jgi:hypothetical protein